MRESVADLVSALVFVAAFALVVVLDIVWERP